MKQILLLGASGSIGTQTIDVINAHQNDFILSGFSVGNNIGFAIELLKNNAQIQHVYVIKQEDKKTLLKLYPHLHVYDGEDGIVDLVKNCDFDIAVNALVGFVGLAPSLEILKKNKILALANKEALVVGGELINDLLSQGHGVIYPIDSEHAAIHKCLAVDNQNVKRLILTASGGAFRKYSREETKCLTKDDALKHPTWKMGAKITIDCATMMNKCFEIIEAHFLFNYPYDRISILLHDESMIHSMVEYEDGTFRAEISHPDMRNPIYYALYEGKCEFDTFISDDFHKFGNYHFHEFVLDRYPLVKYAKQVIDNKGLYGAVLNASNEIAVRAFLNDEISFLQIEDIIDKMMSSFENIAHPSYEVIKQVDKITRIQTRQLIEKLRE